MIHARIVMYADNKYNVFHTYKIAKNSSVKNSIALMIMELTLLLNVEKDFEEYESEIKIIKEKYNIEHSKVYRLEEVDD